MYELINVLPPSNFTVFDCYFLCSLQRAEAAQTAQINQLFQFLNLICVYGYVFYGLTCMLMSKNVDNDPQDESDYTCMSLSFKDQDGNGWQLEKIVSNHLACGAGVERGGGLGGRENGKFFFFLSLMLESNDIFLLELKLHIGEKRTGKLRYYFSSALTKKWNSPGHSPFNTQLFVQITTHTVFFLWFRVR